MNQLSRSSIDEPKKKQDHPVHKIILHFKEFKDMIKEGRVGIAITVDGRCWNASFRLEKPSPQLQARDLRFFIVDPKAPGLKWKALRDCLNSSKSFQTPPPDPEPWV